MGRIVKGLHVLLTDDIVEALHERKMYTVLQFIDADAEDVGRVTGLAIREVLCIRHFFLEKFSAKTVNGFDAYKRATECAAIIPSGIPSVDDLLKGGFLTGQIYELIGASASGKTVFLMNIIKNIMETTQQQVCLFDTKLDFSAIEMKKKFSESNEEKQKGFLNRILVVQGSTQFELLNALYDLKRKLEHNEVNLRLIMIDSLARIRLDITDFTTNNAFYNQLSNILRKIGIQHHITFIITNLITGYSDDKGNFSESIACGRYWQNLSDTKLRIEHLQLDQFRLKCLNTNNSVIITIK